MTPGRYVGGFMSGRMFGTNGVRGISNKDMNCELAMRIGRSVGAVLGKNIAVAMDPRTSSVMLKDALCSGLLSVGADVRDLGMVPTPALQQFVKMYDGIVGGVMITASHNPPEFNGIKCIAADGTECTKEQEDEIERRYREGVEPVEWDSIGTGWNVGLVAQGYVDSVIAKVDADCIRKAGLKVVLDCANGCSCATSPLLLQKLGVDAVVINGTPDMRHPAHLSEPTADNLGMLMETVVAEHADLGVAHDGDADRCVFIARDGRYVPGDLALALLGRYILEKNGGGEIVVTVATSMIVEDIAKKAGGRVAYTAVGSPIVARRMAEDGALFGGEENGGLIFAGHQFCRDGAMGLAEMLECIVKKGDLVDQLDSLPSYRTIKKAVSCPEDLKDKVTQVIASRHSGEKMDTTDGLKFLYDDGWVLLRPSGTEPKYRIYSESRDGVKAEERSKSFVEEFERTVEELRSEIPIGRQLGLQLHNGANLCRIDAAGQRHVHRDVVAEDERPEHVLERGHAPQSDSDMRRSALLQALGGGFHLRGTTIHSVIAPYEQDGDGPPIRTGCPYTQALRREAGLRIAESDVFGILVELRLPSVCYRAHAFIGADHRNMIHQSRCDVASDAPIRKSIEIPVLPQRGDESAYAI